jgi:putative hydrolase of the HAD superfamily
MQPIKVVFLDAGGTLFRPYPSVGEVYSRVALAHGVALDPKLIESRFHEAWHARNGLASLTGTSNDKIERDWWHGLVYDVFAQEMASFKSFGDFFDELYDYFATADCWRLFEDTVPTLDALKQKGFRIGMISNWDHRLMSIVSQLGLTPYFEHIFASSAVGTPKPGLRIFTMAIEAFGIAPDQGLHIGDSLEEDYYGAQRAGLQAVLLDRQRKAYNGVSRVETLRDLLPLIS